MLTLSVPFFPFFRASTVNTWTSAVALNCEYKQYCKWRGPERGNNKSHMLLFWLLEVITKELSRNFEASITFLVLFVFIQLTSCKPVWPHCQSIYQAQMGFKLHFLFYKHFILIFATIPMYPLISSWMGALEAKIVQSGVSALMWIYLRDLQHSPPICSSVSRLFPATKLLYRHQLCLC